MESAKGNTTNQKQIKVYTLDKDSGFVALSEGDAIKNIEEQLGKAKVIDEDPTQKYTSKLHKHLCKLRK